MVEYSKANTTEDIEHFLLDCEALTSTRQYVTGLQRLYEHTLEYKYLDYITWWMYILSHFGRSYCVFQILIQMTVRPRILNTPHIIFMVHTI